MAEIPNDWPQEIRVVFAGMGQDIPIDGTHQHSSPSARIAYYVRIKHTTFPREVLQALTECPLFRFLVTIPSCPPYLYFEEDT